MQANGSNWSGVSSVILGVVVLGLAGTVGTIGLLREIGEFGPKVGDIVSFDPQATLSRDMQTKIAATRVGERTGTACVLDVSRHARGRRKRGDRSQAAANEQRLPRPLGRSAQQRRPRQLRHLRRSAVEPGGH